MMALMRQTREVSSVMLKDGSDSGEEMVCCCWRFWREREAAQKALKAALWDSRCIDIGVRGGEEIS